MATAACPGRGDRAAHTLALLLPVAVLVLIATAEALADLPRPFPYIQSALFVADPTHHLNTTLAGKIADLRAIQTAFAGGEVFLCSLETAADFAEARSVATAIAAARSSNSTAAAFVPLWIMGRPPGFFFPADLARQPAAWRAQNLRSDGSVRTVQPLPLSDNDSLFGFSGFNLDITHPAAVAAYAARVQAAFNASGPPGSSLGPIRGFFLLSEAKLTWTYVPFDGSRPTSDPARADLLPVAADGSAPRLAAGDPYALYTDRNLSFSFYQGPKRYIPLHSEQARRSFVAFAQARGLRGVSVLPLDRLEFNLNLSTVSLPAWAAFEPLDSPVWGVWEDWVYDTWLAFLNTTAEAVAAGQTGNADYLGVAQFQLPGWYSVRGEAASRPLTYLAPQARGPPAPRTEALDQWPAYPQVGGWVGSGLDVTALARMPWLRLFVHEASHGVPIMGADIPANLTDPEMREAWLRSCDWIVHVNNAMAALAQRTLSEAARGGAPDVRFGLFAAGAWKGASVGATISPSAFGADWDALQALLKPDTVCSLPPSRFVQMPGAGRPVLRDIFLQKLREL